MVIPGSSLLCSFPWINTNKPAHKLGIALVGRFAQIVIQTATAMQKLKATLNHVQLPLRH